MASKKALQRIPGYVVLRKLYHRIQLKNQPAEAVFSQIYQKNIWGNTETVSGDGSTLEGTLLLRQELESMLKRLQIRSILDIPCGDFNWMKEMHLETITYTGADIVKDLVDMNTKKFGKTGVEFTQLNVLEDPLPPADLIICKDCLVHFSFEDITKAMNNFIHTPAVYIGFTTFPKLAANKNIVTGEWRPLNLEKPPFNFPPPLHMLRETADGNKCLGIWEMEGMKNMGRR
jgi:hypothetical protein